MPTTLEIAVNYPHHQLLSYLPGDLESVLKPGMLVEIPLGRRMAKGCVLGPSSSSFEPSKLKRVESLLTPDICLSKEDLELFDWMSKHYHYPLGKLLFDSLPKILKRPRKLKWLTGKNLPLQLIPNEQQTTCLKEILPKLHQGLESFLLHGVTGSGKTLIYLKILQEVLASGKSVLFLLPEINLTPQFLEVFESYLNCPIYSYHSSISASDKFGLWKLLQTDDSPKLILGVRSSIFLPIKKLGLIVLDEEHDGSFKQEDRCPYHVRDVAYKRASLLKIPLVFGSATPSLEAYQYFKYKNTKHYFRLDKRANNLPLPQVTLVDERKNENPVEQVYWPLNNQTIERMKIALENNEQVLVYLNRLGFYQYVQCRGCGFQFECPNCSVPLRYTNSRRQLGCQYCDLKQEVVSICPSCSCMSLRGKGFGTERVQGELEKALPGFKVDRFDRDEIKNFKSLEEKLNSFNRGDIDVLVGTQMLSKGHNFERVNLVVVLGMDSQLNFPDFRSPERVFQQLIQVSGRAGRFQKQGEVLIQTLMPGHDLYQTLLKDQVTDFIENELELRKRFETPPFGKLILLYYVSRFRDRLIPLVEEQAQLLKNLTNKYFPQVKILGPKPAAIEKRVNQYTWVIQIKSIDAGAMHQLLNSYHLNRELPSHTRLQVDVDPQTIM